MTKAENAKYDKDCTIAVIVNLVLLLMFVAAIVTDLFFK
jgi:hypothetical protein